MLLLMLCSIMFCTKKMQNAMKTEDCVHTLSSGLSVMDILRYVRQ